MNKREKLAREMAEKSGYDYDKSNKMMQNAWLHNADTEIKREPEVVAVPAKVVIEDGVKVLGIKVDEVAEANEEGTELKVEHIQTTIDIIKDGMERDATKPPEAAVDPFDGATVGAPPAAKTPREPKPGEYLCSRCNTPHRKTSNIGIKHLKRQ